MKTLAILFITLVIIGCNTVSSKQNQLLQDSTAVNKPVVIITEKNQQVLDTIVFYGPKISPTYQKAVCTELLIQVIEKFSPLTKTDKSRIRIITNDDVHTLLADDSPLPKGVYYALTEKGIGMPIDSIHQVLPGDFVQFWTNTWGHCGVVKSINSEAGTMDLYSSFPSTNGYGIQRFAIPAYCYFVRLK